MLRLPLLNQLRRGLLASSAGLALTCAACALPPVNHSLSGPPRNFEPGLVRLGDRAPAGNAPTHQAAASSEIAIARHNRDLAQPTGTAAAHSTSSTSTANPSDIVPVAYSAAPAPQCPPEAIIRCPPEPRWPVAGPNPWAVGMPWVDAACQPSPHWYPDEYLCDGGDREDPVHYHSDRRMGLDTEDTVAEFVDHRGKQRTVPSNKVCVYAPRFAAVRTVSLLREEGTYQELVSVDHTHQGGEVRTRLAPHLGNRHIALHGMQSRARASGLDGDVLPGDVEHRQRPQIADKVLNTFQDFNFFQLGTLEQGEVARLNLGIRAALVWSREEYPVIQAKTDQPVTGLSDIHSAVLTVVDDTPSDQPGQLRLVKVADRHAAQPGDVITFTIRYDNFGPRELHQVRIVDNLTPRLEYVDDSTTSDRTGRLTVEDNGEGSVVLIWEFDEPLAPNSGGVVTFQAKVR
jgi:uncharacterized repeat protein (TIGR01451 family)